MIAKENIVPRKGQRTQNIQRVSRLKHSNQLEVSEGRVRCEIQHHDVMNSGQELGPAITRGREPVKIVKS